MPKMMSFENVTSGHCHHSLIIPCSLACKMVIVNDVLVGYHRDCHCGCLRFDTVDGAMSGKNRCLGPAQSLVK